MVDMSTNHDKWRNRIIGQGTVNPEDLQGNPNNFRRHPLFQQEGMKGILDQVGWVQSVIVNQNTNRLVDGHLRVALALQRGETSIPVVYVDLTEDEEKLILLTLDPLGAMAETDRQNLDRLLHEAHATEAALMEVITKVASNNGLYVTDDPLRQPDNPVLNALQLPSNSNEDGSEKKPRANDQQFVEPTSGMGQAVIQYSIIFDDEEQKQDWYTVIRALKERYDTEGMTIAGALHTFFRENHPEFFEEI